MVRRVWLPLAVFLSSTFICAMTNAAGVDPTRPPGGLVASSVASKAKLASRHSLRLKQILISENQAAAVINDRTVRTGDKLGGYRVKAISANTVKLQSAERTISLKLFPNQITK